MVNKISKYLYLFQKESKKFLYAPLSNSFAELDSDVYEKLLSIRNGNGSLDDLDDEEKDLLIRMKVINVDDDLEINKLKFNILMRRYDPRHLNLTINPTLACNFACPYCFESTHSPQFMSDKVENDIITFIQNHKYLSHLYVTWFGGEPLLAFDRIVTLTKRMQSIGLKYKAGMITNGYLLTEEKVKFFEELQISSVQITIDGLEQTHNARRFKKGGGPTFQTILNNIEQAQQVSSQTKIIVRVNVDRTNSGEFFEVLNYFREKKYPNVVVYPGFVNDSSDGGQNHCVYNSNEIAAFLVDAYHKHHYNSDLFYPNNIIRVCGVRNPNSVVVGPLGELYKCWNDVGNLERSYGYIDGRMTHEAVLYEYLIKADHLNDKKCNACLFFPVCDGGCPYQRIKNESSGCQKDTCSLFKKNIKDFLMLRYNYKNLNKK